MILAVEGSAPTTEQLELIAATAAADRVPLVEFPETVDHSWAQSLAELLHQQHPDIPIWVNQLRPAVRIDWDKTNAQPGGPCFVCDVCGAAYDLHPASVCPNLHDGKHL